MASHLHHHHGHNNHLNSCSCCCSCNSFHPSQVSQSPTTDPLLQAIAAHLLQSSQTHLYAQTPKPQQQQLHQKHLYHKQQQQHQTQSLLYSLIRRVDALESSFRQISASPPPPPPPPTPNSLRDLAAHTIQTHFRAFLVRRSRTLRQLKDLAFIKASLNSLKSSISDGSQLKPEVLSQKAMDLLLKIDSIQGGDPMIRDGKKSVSRDLAQFLEFVDGLPTKGPEISSKASKSLRLAENSNKSRVCINNRDPGIAAENSNKSRVCINNRDPGIGAYQSAFAREFLEKLSSRSQGISDNNEERHVTLDAFHQISDDEDDPKRRPDYGGILMRRHALGSKAKKTVSFAENGNLTRVFEGTHESFSGGLGTGVDGRFSDDDQRELVESREVEEIAEDSEEEEAYMERKEFHQLTDGDRNPRILQREVNYGKRVQRQGQNGEIAFSAPLPVQMEPIIREVRSGTVGGKQ